MRLAKGLALAVAVAVAATVARGVAFQGDPDRVVPGGGIFVKGWAGYIDAASKAQGRKVDDAKFSQEGDAIHVITGPAITYWNADNKVAGNYTVKAHFKEPKFMELNSHPHSYGIVIGGADMGTDEANYLYCVAYGDGRMLVRGFGGANATPGARVPVVVFTPFTTPRNTVEPGVNKAAGVGQPVEQDIQWTVKNGTATCTVNGTAVKEFPAATVVGAGKLKSLDGIIGIRFTHNVEAIITGWSITKQ